MSLCCRAVEDRLPPSHPSPLTPSLLLLLQERMMIEGMQLVNVADNLVVDKVIGKGGYGTVYKGRGGALGLCHSV